MTETITRYDRSRDKYGRSTHTLTQFYPYKVLGVIAKLPGAYTERHPGENYLVNHRTVVAKQEGTLITHLVTYHPTLKAAKAALEANIVPDPPKEDTGPVAPTHVVVDTWDGYTFARDKTNTPFTKDAAIEFANLRNDGLTPTRPKFKVFELKEVAA